MKKFLLSFIVLLLFAVTSTTYGIENKTDVKFVKISLSMQIDSAYALSADGDLYEWGYPFNEIPFRTPQLYMKDVADVGDYYIIKKDGSVYILSPWLKTIENLSGNHYYLKDNTIFLKNNEGIKNVQSDIIQFKQSFECKTCAYLNTKGDLIYQVGHDNETKVERMMTDVKYFDAELGGGNVVQTIMAVKNDGTLWEILEDYSKTNKDWKRRKIESFTNVKKAAYSRGYYLVLDSDGRLWEFNRKDTEQNSGKEKPKLILDDVIDMDIECSTVKSRVAIRKDGTIWYWGAVIGQPKEHVLQDIYTYKCETQDEPVMLSFDPKVNESYVPARMKNFLSNDKNRSLAVVSYPEYYLTVYREHFTEEEIQRMTEKVEEKQKSEAEEASQQLEKEQRLSSSAQESSLAAATATQDKQSDKPKSAATPIIIVILVLLTTVGVGIVYKQKKK